MSISVALLQTLNVPYIQRINLIDELLYAMVIIDQMIIDQIRFLSGGLLALEDFTFIYVLFDKYASLIVNNNNIP